MKLKPSGPKYIEMGPSSRDLSCTVYGIRRGPGLLGLTCINFPGAGKGETFGLSNETDSLLVGVGTGD